jgi:hypothetical protein
MCVRVGLKPRETSRIRRCCYVYGLIVVSSIAATLVAAFIALIPSARMI